MIEKLLNKLGYVRAEVMNETIEILHDYNTCTEDELAFMLAEKLGVQDNIDSDYEKKIFADLKNTDGLVQYLKEAAARDKDRYFGASTPQEQLVIRGAFARTMFLKAKITNSDEGIA